jgi:4-amino-4-deoxy-L-arabinose transferase-like glycosyltransferase
MERAHPGYLYYYFVERHLRGYLTATQRHALRPWWYYLPVLAAGALPWTGYVFVSASKLFRRSMREVNQPLLVTCGWVGLGLIFLGIGESKLVTYALPVVPGLALAAAAAWKGDIRESAGGRAAFLVQTVAMTGLPVLACVAIDSQLGSVTTALWSAAALVTFVVAGIAVAAWIAPTAPRRLARTLIANIVSIGFVLGIAAPYAARWLTGRDLATALNAAGTLPPRVSIYGERIGSVVFYLSPQLRAQATADRIVETTLPTAVPRVAVDPPDAVLAIREQYANRLTRLFKRPVEPDLRAGTFLIYRNDTLRRALR